MPQKWLGMRMLPPRSLPSPSGEPRAATMAASPPVLPPPYQMLLSADYIQGANDNRRADLMTEAAGQGVGFVKSLKPARQIVFDLVEEALAAIEGVTGELG